MTVEATCCAIVFALIVGGNWWDAPSVLDGSVNSAGQLEAIAGDALKQIFFVALSVLSLTISWHLTGLRGLMVMPAALAPILAWCWLSVLWAIDPAIALRRILFTTLVILTCVHCVQTLPYPKIIATLAVSFGLMLFGDMLAVLLVPAAVHPANELDPSLIGAWRGLHSGKNETGAIHAVAVIILLNETIRLRSRLSGPLLVLLGAVSLVFSRSKTALAIVVVAIVVGCLVDLAFRRPRLRQAMLLVIGAFIVPACLAEWETISAAFNDLMLDPSSITGRVQVWPLVLDYVADNPLLGSGYGSFWGIGERSPILQYTSGWIAQIYEAHNGYLDILVQTGVIGLLLALLGLIVLPARLLLFVPLEAGASRSLLCGILVFGWLRDLTESSLLDRANTNWPVFVIALCVLSKYARAPRAVCAAAMDGESSGRSLSLRPVG